MVLSTEPTRGDPAPTLPSLAGMRVINAGVIFGVIGVTLFLATEIFTVAFLTAWALSGLMHLGVILSWAMFLVSGVMALTATAYLSRLAWKAETDPSNN